MTNDTKVAHTPGPWRAVKNQMRDDGYFVQQVANDQSVLWTQVPEGDAHLIAAAPDLLALLKRLRGWDHLDGAADGPYWKQELDAAIAKAEGR